MNLNYTPPPSGPPLVRPPATAYLRPQAAQQKDNIDVYLDAQSLRNLAEGVLDIPESEDRFFTLTKPEGDAILPLPPELSHIYVLKWANPTRIGGGAGAAYSLDVVSDDAARARTRHLYITYMDEAGPSRCRVALAKAIQQLGPILYTAEEDARDSPTVYDLRHGNAELMIPERLD
ncbi:hypothetical protein PsYK624_085390 [Phanerochaete sordida]|uniref:Uncharacterized protein n=1 Tax=Phanerochaete sordida TaxID=48140 RepID=A0A9P3GEP2_9APHY|nr:hypothetical protein PsYK624_085390 [Phanerochaete sordida]